MLLKSLKAKLNRTANRLDRLNERIPNNEPRPWGPEWAGHYLKRYFFKSPADYHRELFEQLGSLHTLRNIKSAIIAPREGAKSTLVTLAYVLRCAVEKLEPYVLLLSDSEDQANEKLSDIRREVDGNGRLAAAYPDACGPGPVWRGNKL